MFLKIKTQIEKELQVYAQSFDKLYSLNQLSPVLFGKIKEYILRPGKRVRPILFCIGYLGFAKKTPSGLYRSALSLELLHDFMLVHDDIIDKSATRRSLPSMHVLFNNYLKKEKCAKFNGEDLSIVIGDVMYAMALDAFLNVKEDLHRKENALRKLISSALYTGSGEFIELLLGIKPLDKVTQNDIYKIYDYKTANYTFASPLTMGATLAGARKNQIHKLFRYGMLLGRAFQIQDDIIGTFGAEKETGKSNLSDIKEAKKTILIWYAFKKSPLNDQQIIKKVLRSKTIKKSQILKIRKIIIQTGALNYAQTQIKNLYSQAQRQILGSKMHKKLLKTLDNFALKTLKI